jgi:hypothetical protein
MALTDAKLRSLKATGKVQELADGGGVHVLLAAILRASGGAPA